MYVYIKQHENKKNQERENSELELENLIFQGL